MQLKPLQHLFRSVIGYRWNIPKDILTLRCVMLCWHWLHCRHVGARETRVCTQPVGHFYGCHIAIVCVAAFRV